MCILFVSKTCIKQIFYAVWSEKAMKIAGKIRKSDGIVCASGTNESTKLNEIPLYLFYGFSHSFIYLHICRNPLIFLFENVVCRISPTHPLAATTAASPPSTKETFLHKIYRFGKLFSCFCFHMPMPKAHSLNDYSFEYGIFLEE